MAINGASLAPAGAGLSYKSAQGRWVIAASVLGSGMAAIDGTVVGIALPTIGRHFHASLGALQWVVTGYTLSLAGLLLLGGSLGDHFGRRRIFCIGVVFFALSSAACGFAVDAPMLIATRILQGVGAALLTPGSLAILQASFVPDDRSRAIGAWSGLGGLATATGPLLGGYLIAAASWRWIFFINIPVGTFVLLLAMRHVPESRDPTNQGRFDIAGATLAMIALAGFIYALIEAPTLGWGAARVLVPLGVGLSAGAVFARVEQRSASPMLSFALFSNSQFAAANAVTFIVYAALSGALFLVPVELQIVDRYSALESGISLLPVTIVMLVFSAQSGKLAARIGPRLQMCVGPVVVGAGLALLVRTSTTHGYVSGVLPGVALFAVGLAITVAPLTATALGAVSEEHAGIASAVNNDVARIGGLLAVAILPELAGITGSAYLHPHALAAGFRVAMVIAGAACATGGVLAGFVIRNPTVSGRRDAVEESSERTHCALEATPLTVSR